MNFDMGNVESEARRIEQIGVVDVTYACHVGRDSEKTVQAVCVGSGVDSDERDFLLFAGPYGAKHRHTLRAIPAKEIKDIKKSRNQSFDRHALQIAKRTITGLTPNDIESMKRDNDA